MTLLQSAFKYSLSGFIVVLSFLVMAIGLLFTISAVFAFIMWDWSLTLVLLTTVKGRIAACVIALAFMCGGALGGAFD